MRLLIPFLLIIFIFLIFFIKYIQSLPAEFTDVLTCHEIFGSCDDTTTDDAPFECNGTANAAATNVGGNNENGRTQVNQTTFLPDTGINVTCDFDISKWANATRYIWYYNGSDWHTIYENKSFNPSDSGFYNVSVSFKLNSSTGEQRIRCAILSETPTPTPVGVDNGDFCLNGTDGNYYDNDDVNFTVTDYPKYDFWNLTNYTTGAEIASDQTFNRTSGNIIYLNVSAHWTNNITHAFLEHNGTGTLTNYTISSFTANWTNVTLNLSDATLFNRKNITITAIYANNSYGLENKTSTPLSFNLDPLSSPNITDYWFGHLGNITNNTNFYTNLTIYANVSDDVGIYAVTANLTYPSNVSIALNLSGTPDPGNRTWNYTFQTETLPLNETGNYTVSWIKVNDTGDQVANLTQNLNFTVTKALNVTVTPSDSTPSNDAYPLTLTINISDINNKPHQYPTNLTINCLNISSQQTNFSLPYINGSTSFALCRAPDSYSYPFNITVEANDTYNNTGEKVTTLTTESAPSSPTVVTGGGGGGGGTVNVTNCTVTPKNCTDGIDNDCDGLTDCGDPDCSRDPDCKIEIKELNFTLSTTSIEIEQGNDGTILASLFNMGNTKLILNTSIEKECCNISLPIGFVLPIKGEQDFSIVIHVPLYQSLGEYTVKVEVYTGRLTKEKAFKIVVKKGSYIASLESLEERISELESALSNYQTLGVHVGNFDNRIEQAKEILANARTNIQNDDLNLVKASVSDLEEILNSMSQQLPTLEIQGFLIENKWYITWTAIIVVISTYMIAQVVIPFHRLGIYIKSLSEEEKTLVSARKAAEKQYFTRKLDEKTFRGIMLDKQAKVLKARAALERSKEERSTLVKKRLHPRAMAGWFKNGFITIGRSIKNAPRKIYNRIRRKEQN